MSLKSTVLRRALKQAKKNIIQKLELRTQERDEARAHVKELEERLEQVQNLLKCSECESHVREKHIICEACVRKAIMAELKASEAVK